MTTRVLIDRVGKNFGSTNVLGDLSLEIEPGSLTFLLGPSGCGKTTLLRIIAGLTQPSSGRVLFNDNDVTSLSARQREVGMVFQSYALWPHMTVKQNVEFGLRARKIDPDNREDRISDILRAVGLEDHADRKPGQLSGGQQQRVALARSLVVKPRLLLLDEPLSNLDAGLRVQLRELIRDLVKEFGLTAIYVTHDQDEAMSVADEIVIMKNGSILQRGNPSEIYCKPISLDVASFMGEANLLPATLMHNNGVARVTTKIGQLLAASAPKATEHLSDVVVAIRPESLMIKHPPSNGAAEEPNTVAGVVHATSRRGLWSRHTVRTEDGVELIALEPGLGSFEPGGQCAVSVLPENVVILPPHA